jgi:hypothetical protein
VIFKGEEGIDEGGVQKEFFQLIVRQMFDLNYGTLCVIYVYVCVYMYIWMYVCVY